MQTFSLIHYHNARVVNTATVKRALVLQPPRQILYDLHMEHGLSLVALPLYPIAHTRAHLVEADNNAAAIVRATHLARRLAQLRKACTKDTQGVRQTKN